MTYDSVAGQQVTDACTQVTSNNLCWCKTHDRQRESKCSKHGCVSSARRESQNRTYLTWPVVRVPSNYLDRLGDERTEQAFRGESWTELNKKNETKHYSVAFPLQSFLVEQQPVSLHMVSFLIPETLMPSHKRAVPSVPYLVSAALENIHARIYGRVQSIVSYFDISPACCECETLGLWALSVSLPT